MIRGTLKVALVILTLTAPPALAQEAGSAPGGVIRLLDKITGAVTDTDMSSGETVSFGSLEVTLAECRYLVDNPAGDAFANLTIRVRGRADPVFAGWMIASSPALNALDHPRYDVWPLRCITS